MVFFLTVSAIKELHSVGLVTFREFARSALTDISLCSKVARDFV